MCGDPAGLNQSIRTHQFASFVKFVLGEDALNSPAKTVVVKLLFLFLCLNVYCRLVVHIKLQVILKKNIVYILSITQRNKLYRNRIKPIDIDISVCML